MTCVWSLTTVWKLWSSLSSKLLCGKKKKKKHLNRNKRKPLICSLIVRVLNGLPIPHSQPIPLYLGGGRAVLLLLRGEGTSNWGCSGNFLPTIGVTGLEEEDGGDHGGTLEGGR